MLRTAIYSSIGNLALPLSALVTGPLLARALGPDGRGVMAALMAPISLANLMFTLGLPDSLAYHVARGRIATGPAVKIALIGGMLCGAVGAIGLLTAAP